ncbi:MAG: hypothetical protein K6T17_08825 [Fimbriimonadales bacterium]|nr:hypothetical protein [Fimbriimonadales bacterium]
MPIHNELWQPYILALLSPAMLFYGLLALFLILILARGLYLWYAPPRPTRARRLKDGNVEIYAVPAWRAQYIKADAVIALTNESGFLGSSSAKFIRDKADYRLDDVIRQHAPLPPGGCLVMPLTRLPARRLAVTNITDENGLITPHSLAEGIKNTASALGKERIPTPIASFLLKLPGLHRFALRFPQKPISSVLLCDPFEDWNYFERRVNEEESARFLLQALLPNLKAFGTVKILVASPSSASAYDLILQNSEALSARSPEPSATSVTG